jgi:hypothetical protein
MQRVGKQPVKAYPSMCTVQESGGRVHERFRIGRILGFVHRYASTNRGRAHSIEEGAAS